MPFSLLGMLIGILVDHYQKGHRHDHTHPSHR